MDMKNPFESPTTFRLHRAEYLVGWIVCTALIILHWNEIRLLPAIILFAYIDLIGYIPGAIAFRRSPDGRISKNYYIAYNVMHSMITQGAVIAIWGFTIGWEWALIVIPWHLFADRGVYGNFLKPFRLPFEPHPAPGYQRLMDELSAATPATTGDRTPEAARVSGT
ncbi:hypothetical protein ALI144C_36430 [Actinosynnema sp. ALI-1.44]|uniref:hypothetical protein n=1 Tax=Actinosynnema sp. ALI-1.44 TaxID=1933779 RepID=UPI00097C594B|nr:hypothetical protein [Actinosynnema sp. ALI-1.44]ONI76167.1 hypothetical protein ALI144C_36430 [Actinosynnema sp. ALI-1.44]